MEISIRRYVAAPARVPGVRRRWLRDFGPLGALAVLVVVFQLASGSFLTAANLQSVIETAAVPALQAAGLSFVIILGAIDLSLEGIMAASSMVLSLLVANNVNHESLGPWGIAAALGVGLAFGLANGVMNAFLRMPSLIVTLGTWFIGLGIAAVLFPQRVPEINEPLVLGLMHVHVLGFSLIVYITLGVLAASYVVLSYTSLGRMIYAIGGDEGVVTASGVPVRGYKLAAFAISGVVAALAGIFLSAQLSNGDADIGNGLLFPAISAAVLGGTLLSGGRGGVLQSALGALILEVLSNGLIQIGAGPYIRHIISGAVIVAAVALGGWQLRSKLRVMK